MRNQRVAVDDLMQTGYVYYCTEPAGMNFRSDFNPELTPKEMLELGVFGGKYMTDLPEGVSRFLVQARKAKPRWP